MVNKKGFELSMSLIAVVIVVLVVLAIVIVFVSGASGNLFGKINVAQNTLTTDDIQTFQLGCKNACTQAKQMVSSETQWKASKYCKMTVSGGIDTDKDGEIGGYPCKPVAPATCSATTGGKCGKDCATVEIDTRNCWVNEVGVDCSVTVTDANNKQIVCNPTGGSCICPP